MKHQDYIKIMDRIQDKYVEEAVTWDASAQNNRRSIRRLTLGIGAIAAAIAVVIGGIGYNAYRDNLFANSNAENNDLTGNHLNLFGGHGEIRSYICSSGMILYRDDDNYYFTNGTYSDDEELSEGGPSPDSFFYIRWAVNGSSSPERLQYDGNLLTDGERLYNYHDNELYITDSYGNETAFLAAPWKPNKIQKLSDDWYFLSACIEDSWLQDAKPQPYVLINTKGDQINQFVDYPNVQSDGENLYYSDFESNIYAAPLTNVLDAHAVTSFDDGELLEWTLTGDKIYSLNLGPFKSDINDSTVLYCSELPQSENELADQTMYDIPDEMDYRNYRLLNDHLYVFGVQFGEGGRTLLECSSFTNNESKEYFNVETASLWDREFSDGDIENYVVCDTGDSILFMLPIAGKNNEIIVQINKETNDYQYIYYTPEQIAPENTPADGTVTGTEPAEDSGFCSPTAFPLYYIPAEHMDSDSIECYRMLPAVPASNSAFDENILDKTVDGGFRPRTAPVIGTGPAELYETQPEHYISYDEAREIILNHDPTDTNSLFSAIDKAAGEYTGKYICAEKVCYEYWCKEDGSEFLVAMCSYAGETETIQYVYFRYDADAQQFAYEYLPARTRSEAPAEKPAANTADAETNLLGGKGKIRVYNYKFETYAEDDEYIYSFMYDANLNTDFPVRARKNDTDPVFERFTVPNLPQYDPAEDPQDTLHIIDGMVLLDDNGILYEVQPGGSLKQLLAVTEDSEGNQLENAYYWRIQGFAKDASGRPTKLFMNCGAEIAGQSSADNLGYNQFAVLNLKTGKYQELHPHGYPTEFAVSENAVYMAGYSIGTPHEEPLDVSDSNYELVTFDENGQPILCSTPEWGFGGLDGDVFDADGNIWFYSGKNQKRCKGNTKDHSFTVVSREEWFKSRCLPGTNQLITRDSDPDRIILCTGSYDNETVLKEGGEYPAQALFLRGNYTENGIIHFFVSEIERNETGSDKIVQLIFFTVDGNSVSSFSVKYPE